MLEPASESAGGVTASDSGEDGEYFLTLNNVKEDALWYTDRPGRKAGETSIGDYVGSWADIYGEVAPNAAMDGYLTDAVHAGLYLNLRIQSMIRKRIASCFGRRCLPLQWPIRIPMIRWPLTTSG